MTTDLPVSRTGATAREVLVDMNAAGRRYWTDAKFHARVVEAVRLAEVGQPNDGFQRFHRDSLTAGACMALHLADCAALLAEQPGGGLDADRA